MWVGTDHNKTVLDKGSRDEERRIPGIETTQRNGCQEDLSPGLTFQTHLVFICNTVCIPELVHKSGGLKQVLRPSPW